MSVSGGKDYSEAHSAEPCVTNLAATLAGMRADAALRAAEALQMRAELERKDAEIEQMRAEHARALREAIERASASEQRAAELRRAEGAAAAAAGRSGGDDQRSSGSRGSSGGRGRIKAGSSHGSAHSNGHGGSSARSGGGQAGQRGGSSSLPPQTSLAELMEQSRASRRNADHPPAAAARPRVQPPEHGPTPYRGTAAAADTHGKVRRVCRQLRELLEQQEMRAEDRYTEQEATVHAHRLELEQERSKVAAAYRGVRQIHTALNEFGREMRTQKQGFRKLRNRDEILVRFMAMGDGIFGIRSAGAELCRRLRGLQSPTLDEFAEPNIRWTGLSENKHGDFSEILRFLLNYWHIVPEVLTPQQAAHLIDEIETRFDADGCFENRERAIRHLEVAHLVLKGMKRHGVPLAPLPVCWLLLACVAIGVNPLDMSSTARHGAECWAEARDCLDRGLSSLAGRESLMLDVRLLVDIADEYENWVCGMKQFPLADIARDDCPLATMRYLGVHIVRLASWHGFASGVEAYLFWQAAELRADRRVPRPRLMSEGIQGGNRSYQHSLLLDRYILPLLEHLAPVCPLQEPMANVAALRAELELTAAANPPD